MIIDDEPIVLKVLARFLTAHHEVFSFAAGPQAVEVIERGERFDAIVCDLAMPRMSGRAFFEEVARVSPGEEERIVFLTGGAVPPTSEPFFRRIDNPVLEKPLSGAQLNAAIHAVCGVGVRSARVPTMHDAAARRAG